MTLSVKQVFLLQVPVMKCEINLRIVETNVNKSFKANLFYKRKNSNYS